MKQTQSWLKSLNWLVALVVFLNGGALVFAATDSFQRDDTFVIDTEKNGITYIRKNGLPRVGIGVSTTDTLNELDVANYARLDFPVFMNNAGSSPLIDWSVSNVQSINVQNSNFEVNFMVPPVSASAITVASDAFEAHLTLIIYVARNAAGTITGWKDYTGGATPKPIRWRNGSPPIITSSSTQNLIYVVFFSALKEVNTKKVTFYGWY